MNAGTNPSMAMMNQPQGTNMMNNFGSHQSQMQQQQQQQNGKTLSAVADLLNDTLTW